MAYGSRLASAAVVAILTLAPPAAAAALVCSADRAIADGGETVTVTAYVDAGRVVQSFGFTGPDGVIRGQARARTSRSFSAQWILPRSRGTYELRASVTFGGNARESCGSRVVVTGPDLGPGVKSARRLLLPSESEQPGYGSYTYLLCPSAAAAQARLRCAQALTSILAAFKDIEKFERNFPRAELNAVYVPMESDPPPSASAAEKIRLYDEARAERWLDTVDPTLRDGPYVFTVAKPLDAKAPQPVIFQDLSGVPVPLVGEWITAYMRQLSQQTAYGRSFEPSLALRMRTVLGVLAMALPDITSALNTIVAIR